MRASKPRKPRKSTNLAIQVDRTSQGIQASQAYQGNQVGQANQAS